MIALRLRLRLTAAIVAVLGLAAVAPTSVNAVTCAETAGLELKVPCSTIPTGGIHSPITEFRRMTDTAGTGFTGVLDPLGSGTIVVRNTNPSGLSDAHVTMGTTRDLPVGSTSCAAFAWLYRAPADLVQTGRNLFYQVQITGSPVVAISTKAGNVEFVWRNPTTEHRELIGAIPWGHWMRYVVCQKIASSGFVSMWYAVDGWPDVSKPALFSHTGINTNQGGTGHNTIGQYATHSKTGVYIGYFRPFGRATTPARAVAIAGS